MLVTFFWIRRQELTRFILAEPGKVGVPLDDTNLFTRRSWWPSVEFVQGHAQNQTVTGIARLCDVAFSEFSRLLASWQGLEFFHSVLKKGFNLVRGDHVAEVN